MRHILVGLIALMIAFSSICLGRQLHQNAVDLGVLVQHLHQFQQLLLCGILIQCVLKGLEPNRLACFFLICSYTRDAGLLPTITTARPTCRPVAAFSWAASSLTCSFDNHGYFLRQQSLPCSVPPQSLSVDVSDVCSSDAASGSVSSGSSSARIFSVSSTSPSRFFPRLLLLA